MSKLRRDRESRRRGIRCGRTVKRRLREWQLWLATWIGICGFGAPICRAETWSVPGDFTTIQQAIDASNPGDTVLVSAGIYPESIRFFGKGIEVRSLAGPEETRIEAETESVVLFADGEGPSSVLSGFTLAGGTGTDDWTGFAAGGAVLIHDAGPLLEDLIIEDNSASEGGGIYVIGFGASPTIRGCWIRNNSADFSGGGLGVNGGSIVVEDCIFDQNDAVISGGGFWLQEGAAVVTGTRFLGNSSQARGGGVSVVTATALFSGCAFQNNACPLGAGLFVQTGSVDLEFTVWGDNVGTAGAAIRGEGSASIGMFRCTLGAQDADTAAAVALLATELSGTDSIVWGNGVDSIEASGVGSSVDLTYCNIEGGFPGFGNFSLDPEFTDPTVGDYRLLPTSPCIDAGNPDGPEDDDGSPPDLGAIPFIADSAGAYLGGDCDGDGQLNIADVVNTLILLFAEGGIAPCELACDVNQDVVLNVADAITSLNILFIDPFGPFNPLSDCQFVPSSPGPLTCESPSLAACP